MTLIPSFLTTGILAVIVGIAVLVWAAAFIQRRNGGAILILLSIVLLLFGGGFFPPLIGIVAGVAGIKINTPLDSKPVHRSGSALPFLAELWPWPFVVFLVWILGQWIVGYYFNEFMQEYGFLSLLLIIGLLPLSLISAYAHDVYDRARIEG